MSDVVNEEINSVEAAGSLHGISAHILPNPVHGQFALELTGCAALHSASLEIVDVTGRQVHHRTITVTGDSHREQFDLDLPYGVYFIRVSHGVASKVVRFVVEG